MVPYYQNTPWNRFEGISPPGTQPPTLYPHLFSVEQKNCTQGLVLLLSEEGGRYMASEKQVSSSFSSSVLEGEVKAWSHSGLGIGSTITTTTRKEGSVPSRNS